MGIDRPMKVLSMHILLYRKKCQNSQNCHFVKNYIVLCQTPTCSVQYVYFELIKNWKNSSKAVGGVYQPMKAQSMHIQEPY